MRFLCAHTPNFFRGRPSSCFEVAAVIVAPYFVGCQRKHVILKKAVWVGRREMRDHPNPPVSIDRAILWLQPSKAAVLTQNNRSTAAVSCPVTPVNSKSLGRRAGCWGGEPPVSIDRAILWLQPSKAAVSTQNNRSTAAVSCPVTPVNSKSLGRRAGFWGGDAAPPRQKSSCHAGHDEPKRSAPDFVVADLDCSRRSTLIFQSLPTDQSSVTYARPSIHRLILR